MELLSERPDVVSFGARAFLDETNIDLHEIYTNLKEGFNPVTLDLLSQIYKECSWMPWLRICKRDLFIDKNFPKGILLEDVYLFSILCLNINTINHCNEVLVNYRIRAGSSVGQQKDSSFESYHQVIDYLMRERERSPYLINLNLNKLLKSYFQESINSRGLKFAFSNIQKYQKNKEYMLFITYRTFVYLVKKMLGKDL